MKFSVGLVQVNYAFYISYDHSADYIQHQARAYETEQSPAAKDAIAFPSRR
jgi:tartrate dehydratase alpha subunit/fumarate hydratase class I-like protein